MAITSSAENFTPASETLDRGVRGAEPGSCLGVVGGHDPHPFAIAYGPAASSASTIRVMRSASSSIHDAIAVIDDGAAGCRVGMASTSTDSPMKFLARLSLALVGRVGRVVLGNLGFGDREPLELASRHRARTRAAWLGRAPTPRPRTGHDRRADRSPPACLARGSCWPSTRGTTRMRSRGRSAAAHPNAMVIGIHDRARSPPSRDQTSTYTSWSCQRPLAVRRRQRRRCSVLDACWTRSPAFDGPAGCRRQSTRTADLRNGAASGLPAGRRRTPSRTLSTAPADITR